MKGSTDEHIEDERLNLDGEIVSYQTIRCSHEGCSETKRTVKNSKSRPADVIFNMARKAGWKPDPKKGQHLCPIHANPRKKTMAKPTTGLKKPTQERTMTKADQRAIFRLIDVAYDEDAQRYKGKVTDQHISKEAKVPVGWVQSVREDHFGPAGPDPRIVKLEEEVTEIKARATELYDTAMKVAETAETLMSDSEKIIVRLKTVQGVGA